MTKDELLKYLKSAITLETDIVTQESIISEYSRISLEKKPQLTLQEEPSHPPKPRYNDYNAWSKKNQDDGKALLVIFGSVGIVVGVPLLFVVPVLGVVFILAGIGCCLPLINKKKEVASENNAYVQQHELAIKQYHEELNRVKKQNETARQTYNKEISAWNTSDEKNKAILNEPLEKTKLILSKLYSNDYIYAKYQNLPALTSIYEYLLTGRCEELSGAHGAYNLYEDELRKDTVISQLNTVIDNLEQIKQNQFMLYQQAKLIRKETIAISDELRQMKGYTIYLTELTALNTYYSALTARNTDISATFALLNG